MGKRTPITVDEDKAQATVFARRQLDPHVTAQRVGADTVVLMHHQLGEVGSRTMFYRRGRLVRVLYVLPTVDVDRLAVFGPEAVEQARRYHTPNPTSEVK